MKRTYDVFVDNGLFVLSYYLKKPIEDITENDIINNIDLICNKIYEFVECEKYSNLKSMMFPNSALTQTSSDKTINDYLKVFSNSKGEDVCKCCGKNRTNIKTEGLHRSYLPNYVANPFYNFSNNFMGVNVCGICSILTMFSILNARVYGLAYLYNSDNDDFMYDYTEEIQEENKKDILLKAKKDKDNKITNTNLIENLLNNNKIYDGYIQIYRFNNSGQSQDIDVQDINSDNLKLLSKIVNNNLLKEFKENNLMINLLKNNIENTYVNKIIKNDELKCSRELFDFLNMEVNKLSEDIKNIIFNICDKLKDEDTRKIRNKLKLINSFKDFERFVVELGDNYSDTHEDKLYSRDEYLIIDNRIKYNQIKNLMIVSLM